MSELPGNADAEAWLLGGIFQDPKAMAQFAHALEPCDFFLEKHRAVWEAFQALQKDNAPIDIVSVSGFIKNTPAWQSLFGGGSGYLFELMESVASAANAGYFVGMIAKSSALRRLHFVLQRISSEALEPAADADLLAASALERISAIANRHAGAGEEHISGIALQVLGGIKERMLLGLPAGIPTGFASVDEIAGGLRPGELIVLGARTGMGKTSFALDIALHAAKAIPVKFFSLEMAKSQIAFRVLSFANRINLKRTVNAELSDGELETHFKTAEDFSSLNLYAEFEAGFSISEICASAHSFCARRGKGLIVIDHLHYIKTDGKKYENRNIELGKVTHALKELAKKLDIPILLLSQLNRDIDRAGGKDKKPRLSDLRDSGSIEQDSDMVWFIHRPGYYDGAIPPSETDIIIAKNRSGPTGEARLHFDASTAKFQQ